MAYLTIKNSAGEAVRHELTGITHIGRAREMEVWLDDQQASRRHCKLELVDGQWVLRDLLSHNGTLLNETPVNKKTLKDGDVIEIGRTRIVFNEGAAVRVRPASPFEAKFASELVADMERHRTPVPASGETLTGESLPVPRPRAVVAASEISPEANEDESLGVKFPLASPSVKPLDGSPHDGDGFMTHAVDALRHRATQFWHRMRRTAH